MLFSRQMYTLLKAGVPILRALGGLQESATNSALARVIQDLRSGLDSGRELSAAMRLHPQVFSAYYISMVRVGEMTGQLENVFDRLSMHLEFEKDMRDRVKSALQYPIFVVVAMVIALVIVNLFVIPVFAQMFKDFGAQLPFFTRVLIGFSDFSVAYWPVLAAAALAALIAFKVSTSKGAGKYAWDRFKLRIPIAGKIVLKATLARFARSFALSIKSGVPMVQALTIVREIAGNAVLARALGDVEVGVREGAGVSAPLARSGAVPALAIQMIGVGEETGRLDEMMLRVAEHYDKDVRGAIQRFTRLLEPVMIVVMSLLVGFVVISMLNAVFSLNDLPM